MEKHFTLSRLLPGIDQKSSLDPHELKDLAAGVHTIAAALGDKKNLMKKH